MKIGTLYVGDLTNNLWSGSKDFDVIEFGTSSGATVDEDIHSGITFNANTVYTFSFDLETENITYDASNPGNMLYFEIQYTVETSDGTTTEKGYAGITNTNYTNTGRMHLYTKTNTDSTKTYTISSIALKKNNRWTGGSMEIKNFKISEGKNTNDLYEPYNKYKIPLEITKLDDTTETQNIYLSNPLRKDGENVDYIKDGKVVRNVRVSGELPADIDAELPEIYTGKGIKSIEVKSTVPSSLIKINWE